MPTLRETVERVIKEKNLPVTIDWDSAFRRKRNTIANVYCNNCGFVHIRQVDNCRQGRFTCNNCIHLTYNCRANEIGFNFIGMRTVGKKSLVVLECKIDGAIKEVQSGSLMRNKIRCDDCLLNSYRGKLAERGCELVSYDGYRILFKNSFGVLKDIQAGALSTGEWVAENSTWENPSTVYCFSFTAKDIQNLKDGFYFKIGFSRYPTKRLSKLELTIPADIQIIEAMQDRFQARKLEFALHTKYSEYKLDREIAKTFTKGFDNGWYENGIRIRGLAGTTEWFYSEQPIVINKEGVL